MAFTGGNFVAAEYSPIPLTPVFNIVIVKPR